MSNKLTDKVSFDFIRYANCWEDADVLSEALNVPPGAKILSIASAGDNSFAMLLKDPGLVVAVDVNEIQLFLVELKKACFRTLEYEETISFLGFSESKLRRKLFEKVQKELSMEAKAYWIGNFQLIENGLIHAGKFEKYFQLFCRKILPWIHSKDTVKNLFTSKTEEEQRIFYTDKWNNWRWRLLFKVFFSKTLMGKFGRDPEFLKQVEINVSEYIFQRAEAELSSKKAFNNFILRYNLSSDFGGLLPLYLQPENYGRIRANIDRIEIYRGFAEDAIKQYGKFDAMNLSNIFEYLDPLTFRNVSSALIDGLNEKGKMAYWNLMVPRRVSEIFPGQVSHNEKVSSELMKIDKGFFYSKFILDEKNE